MLSSRVLFCSQIDVSKTIATIAKMLVCATDFLLVNNIITAHRQSVTSIIEILMTPPAREIHAIKEKIRISLIFACDVDIVVLRTAIANKIVMKKQNLLNAINVCSECEYMKG